MREGTITDLYDTDDLSFMRHITSQGPVNQNAQFVTQSITQGTNMVSSTTFSSSEARGPVEDNKTYVNVTFCETMKVLNEKIQWATEELKRTNSLEYNISLCQMIKSAADALHSVKLAS